MPWLAFLFWFGTMLLALPGKVWAVTYANTSIPFAWIDASAHNRLSATSAPYRLNGGGGCGTSPPIIDDTISDLIPIGFTFNYGGVAYTNLRVQTNGRIQLGDNVFCGSGTENVGPPQTYPYRYPNASVGASMRIYGADLDPTPQGTAGYTTSCVAGSCYLSYALIGTAPNRSFVVTWNNVPEWIGTSRAGGNFNLQIILQENGEFIYQYGVNVHGANGLAEIGWQVLINSINEYDVPGFGLPANNTAIKFYIPRPVAEYRMEQPSWNGTAGEVIDSSGYGRHGIRTGTATTTPNGRVCRGATIGANTTLASVEGIQTSVNVGTAVGGQGTITFWYKSNAAWNAANSERQLFDASVAGNYWFFLTKRANGRLRFVLSNTAGGVHVAEVTVSNTAANTWRHVAVTWNFNALAAANSDRMRIYVDGVLVREVPFSTNETLYGGLGNLLIGDNNNIDSSAQNGTPKSADGVVDEFRIYNFEGGIGLIQRDMAASGCLGHYAISAVAGSTCQATQVTVTAHDTAHTPLYMPNNTTMITLSTSTNRGDWSLISGYGVLNNGAGDDGVATYVFNGEYQAVFGYQTSSSGNVNFDVTDGQLREQEDPNIVVGACSVSFNACELVAGRCTPTVEPFNYARLNTKLASTAFNLDVVALNASKLLNTGFNGTVAVDLVANVNNGIALGGNNCPISQTAIIPLGNVSFVSGRGPLAGVPVATTAFSSVAPNYRAYRDVRVRFTCDSANCPTAGLVTCSSDNFAVRPTTFSVASSMNNTNRTGSPRAAAGTDFTMTATAVPGYNGSPQIDRRANPPTCFDAAMPNANKVLDHDGICIDRLYDQSQNATIAAFSAAAAATGAATGTFQYHDVGNFQLAPGAVYDSTFTNVDQPSGCVVDNSSNVADGSGKFGCNVGNAAATSRFGRFYVDHFAVTAGSAVNGCPAGGFTYMGHAGIRLTYTVQAQSRSLNLLTTKYISGVGGYLPAAQMGNVDLVALADDTTSGISGTVQTARIGGWTTPNPSWVGGEQKVIALPLAFSRPAATPDGPFPSIVFGARVSGDVDGAVLPTRDMRDTGAACSGAACTHVSLNAATPVATRFGMLRLNPALGSDQLPLTMSADLLYYNQVGFVPNSADTCTTIPVANLLLGNWRTGFVGGETSITNNAATVVSGNLTFPSGGRGTMRLAKPGKAGKVDVTAGLAGAGMTYLQGNQGSATFSIDPAATATFGVYKGPNQIIHMRENF